MKGKIFLIPTTLGSTDSLIGLPPEIQTSVQSLSCFIVENIRTARRFIKKLVPDKIIDEITFFELNQHSNPVDYSEYISPALSGTDIGIISEAGNPGIADPGAEIVKLAHQNDIQVIPLVGPSSILLALISSGLNGQNFAFNGYLPVERSERIKKIQSLENRSKSEQQSQIFMETPYRNMKILEDILNACKHSTLLCIAADITLPSEFIKTKSIADWKKKIPQIDKRPCIFIIHSGL
jgi:16S rRNA (cytidine1402-2'-O)-methyltransferase